MHTDRLCPPLDVIRRGSGIPTSWNTYPPGYLYPHFPSLPNRNFSWKILTLDLNTWKHSLSGIGEQCGRDCGDYAAGYRLIMSVS